MSIPRRPYLDDGQPAPAPPRDWNTGTVLEESERGQDELRNDQEHALLNEPPRRLTQAEQEMADHDAGDRHRTYAPASERVAKAPAPGDDRLIEEGLHHPISPEAARHPGDRSDPAELR